METTNIGTNLRYANVCSFGKDKELIIENREAILADFKMLFTQDKTFIESIESSTASLLDFNTESIN